MYPTLGNMRLDYGIQMSPFPITLSVGTLKKPKLREIFDSSLNMSFEKFNQFEVFLKMTPKKYYTVIMKNDNGVTLWNSLSDEQKKRINMYDIIIVDKRLQYVYTEILNYFFVENVEYNDTHFVLSNNKSNDISDKNIVGIIDDKIFDMVLNIICQICCINTSNYADKPKFKNKTAQQIYEKIQNAPTPKEKSNTDSKLTIPNIISSVVALHPSINYSNVWDLTIFQLLDTFNRMTINSIHKISSARVAVWGDKEQKFDSTTWYKNYYDL